MRLTEILDVQGEEMVDLMTKIEESRFGTYLRRSTSKGPRAIRSKAGRFWRFYLALLVLSLTLPDACLGLEKRLDHLAGEIKTQLEDSDLTSVTVVDLTDLSGDATSFGRFVAEELNIRLAKDRSGYRVWIGFTWRVSCGSTIFLFRVCWIRRPSRTWGAAREWTPF